MNAAPLFAFASDGTTRVLYTDGVWFAHGVDDVQLSGQASTAEMEMGVTIAQLQKELHSTRTELETRIALLQTTQRRVTECAAAIRDIWSSTKYAAEAPSISRQTKKLICELGEVRSLLEESTSAEVCDGHA